uniref:K Homology domain-containing protein n=1 Tax=Chromera velia CCMP2878 TaxID=1169474 RepID=A0A0G4I7G6_9ALVE|eukprot:Cvel_11660.t1-p1 / transcript=Cvel_11660.t1 / gene=Cvel_11660 / organism=Chromera_velia_CCMP2878 / gene_product=hypothetical protein / transcript_product=hypothetical protein / location=Cvel_scaffold739:22114-25443(-) / protein_length=800 / sequence_SO=supercontig / SO=protein_coding / is_pseudo=false
MFSGGALRVRVSATILVPAGPLMDDRIAAYCATYGVFNSLSPPLSAVAEGWSRITLSGMRVSVIDTLCALHDTDLMPLRIILPGARGFEQGENFRRQVEDSRTLFGTEISVGSLNLHGTSAETELVLTISGSRGTSLAPLRAFSSSIFRPAPSTITTRGVGDGFGQGRDMGLLSLQTHDAISTHTRLHSAWQPTQPTYPQQIQTATATPGTYGRTGAVGLGIGVGGGEGVNAFTPANFDVSGPPAPLLMPPPSSGHGQVQAYADRDTCRVINGTPITTTVSETPNTFQVPNVAQHQNQEAPQAAVLACSERQNTMGYLTTQQPLHLQAHVSETARDFWSPPFPLQQQQHHTLVSPTTTQPQQHGMPVTGNPNGLLQPLHPPATQPAHHNLPVEPIPITGGASVAPITAQQTGEAMGGGWIPGGGPNQNQNQDKEASGEDSTKYMGWIPAHFVPRLIGGGGKCKGEFQNRSGAKIQYGSVTSADGMRELKISGTERQIAGALELVENKIASWTARDKRGPVKRTLWVPDEIANQLVGKKGAKISEFQLSSGACVDIGNREIVQMGRVRDITESLGIEATGAAQEMAVHIYTLLTLTTLPGALPLPSPNMPTRLRRVVVSGTQQNVSKCTALITNCVRKILGLAAKHLQNPKVNVPPPPQARTTPHPQPHAHPQPPLLDFPPHTHTNPILSRQPSAAAPPFYTPSMTVQQPEAGPPPSPTLSQPPQTMMHYSSLTTASGAAVGRRVGASSPSSYPGMIVGSPPVHVQNLSNVYHNNGLPQAPTPVYMENSPPYDAAAPGFFT